MRDLELETREWYEGQEKDFQEGSVETRYGTGRIRVCHRGQCSCNLLSSGHHSISESEIASKVGFTANGLEGGRDISTHG